MRITFFPASAIGHVGYPEAILIRGLAHGLLEQGHDVRLVEERRNPVLTRSLEHEGSAVSRHVFDAHPTLAIHTFTPRTGAPLMEWISRELSLVDVGVAVNGLPDEVGRWIANLTHPKLIRAFMTYRPLQLDEDLKNTLEIDRYDAILAPAQPAANTGWEPVPPAIAPADLEAGLLEHIPSNLRDALVEPRIAARAFETAIARMVANRYSTTGNSSNHSSNSS